MSSKVIGVMPPPEERFHANIVKMTGLIRSIVVEANKAGYQDVTPFVVDLASKYLRDNYDKKGLIEGFILSSHPPVNSKDPNSPLDHTLWDKILAKDEVFFRESAFDIFKNLPLDAVVAFKKLSVYCDPQTGLSIINPKQKEEIIMYFHAFVKISIKYIHANRQPYIVEENGKKKFSYGTKFMPGIDVLTHAKKWNVDLEFARG